MGPQPFLLNSPPLEGWQAKPDGVVLHYLDNHDGLLIATPAALSDGTLGIKQLCVLSPRFGISPKDDTK